VRILLVATDAFGGHGGIALFNRELSEAISKIDAVRELVVVPRKVAYEPPVLPPRVTFSAGAAKSPVRYARTIAALRRQPFDLVVCGHVNLLPVAAAIGRPLLITHGIEAWRPPRRRLSSLLLHRCRGVVSVSALTRDRFLEWSRFAGPAFVLPNAIHASDYGIRPRRADLVERFRLGGRRVLLTVGRLDSRERYKGFDEVIDVLPALPPDVVYVIAGGGNDFERLRARAKSAGVADRVVFTGLFDDRDKPDFYSLADAYVMPSRGEGFGFVVLEALASGVPVVASKHDGTREAVLDGKLGLLVDPANPAEIAAAIRETLERHERRIEEGLEFFSFENFARRVREIIETIVRLP
jgi:glycosyltransferase involved in cell wall biosynthesis